MSEDDKKDPKAELASAIELASLEIESFKEELEILEREVPMIVDSPNDGTPMTVYRPRREACPHRFAFVKKRMDYLLDQKFKLLKKLREHEEHEAWDKRTRGEGKALVTR